MRFPVTSKSASDRPYRVLDIGVSELNAKRSINTTQAAELARGAWRCRRRGKSRVIHKCDKCLTRNAARSSGVWISSPYSPTQPTSEQTVRSPNELIG